MIKPSDSWAEKTLSEWGVIAETGFASGKHNSSGSGVIHLRPMNIDRNGQLDFSQTKFVDPEVSAKRIFKGDILFNNTNSPELVGKTSVFDQTDPLAFSNHMTRLIVPGETVDANYLAIRLHTLWRDGYFKEICSNHVNQASISTKRLLQVEVALPTLEVQKRIVTTLNSNLMRIDKAFLEIENGKHKSEALLRSVRQDIFSRTPTPAGWSIVNLSEVLEQINGKRLTQRGWSPQCLNHSRSSDLQWGVLKTTAIQLGDFQPQHHKELPPTLNPKEEIEIHEGDLIMTATGPRNRCGIPCLVIKTPRRLMMSGKMFRFRTNQAICDSRWLLEFLLSDLGQTQLESLKVGSSDSSVSIGAEQFSRIQMPLPPIEEQIEILQELDKHISKVIQFSEATTSTSIQLPSLRLSLLNAAFNGQLNTEDSND